MSQRDFKDQVLAAVPIETYIGRYTPLKRAGKYLKGLCPFHGEKTPSFTVTPEKGLYHCFGCGRGGDLIRFVMDIERLPFNEALDTLARFAGIERPKGGRSADPNQRYYDLNDRVARAFQAQLESSDGRDVRDYLVSRGLTAETIAHFQLGASPDSWDWLKKKFPADEATLVELGLLKRGQSDAPYDFFRHRAIFPIRDVSGRAAGFGGRILPGSDNPAKYINSPESPVFHKSRILYGLFQALPEIRAKSAAVIVEGYLDVIGLHQAGVKHAVAPLGTALTPEHLALLSRYAREAIAIFDGDRAGRNAALKFSRLALDRDMLRATVILLPGGLDPFDAARQLPRPRLDELFATRFPAERLLLHEVLFPELFVSREGVDALPVWEYAAQANEYYSGRRPEWTPSGLDRRPALDRLYASLGELSRDSDRRMFLEEGARALGLDPASVRREWEERHPGAGAARSSAGAVRAPDEPGFPGGERSGRAPALASASVGAPRRSEKTDPWSVRVARAEQELALELLYAPELFGRFQAEISDLNFVDPHAEFLWRYLETRYLTGNLWTGAEFSRFDLPEETVRALGPLAMERAEARSDGETDPALVVSDLLRRRRRFEIKKWLVEWEARYTVADSVEKAYLLEEQARLLKEYTDLESRERRPGSLTP